jgi:hypothetical protein
MCITFNHEKRFQFFLGEPRFRYASPFGPKTPSFKKGRVEPNFGFTFLKGKVEPKFGFTFLKG